MHLVGQSERRAEPGFGSEVEMRAERRHLRVGVTHTAAGVAKEREVVALTEAQRVPTDEEAGAVSFRYRDGTQRRRGGNIRRRA